MNVLHLVMIPVTGVGLRGFRGQEWLERRIEIFKKYTLKSLQNQETKDFILVLTFRPEEKGNYAVELLAQHIEDTGLKAVFTFHGLLYHDDKFNKGIFPRLMNLARVMRYSIRTRDISELFSGLKMLQNKNDSLLGRLSLSLAELASVPGFTSVDWVYLTRIDSDDMFHKNSLKEVQSHPPFRGALVHSKGYVYNSNTGEVAEWLPKTNPPFHTILFPKDDFFEPKRHLQYYRGYKSHEDIPRIMPTLPLTPYTYCVVTGHGEGISTTFDHPFRGAVVDKKVLEDYGLENS